MARIRRRCLLAPALVLLACTAPAKVEQPRCSVIEGELLATRLRAADPHEQGPIVREGLDAVCEWELLGNYGDQDPGLIEAGEAVFARVCPAARELGDDIYVLAPSYLYGSCDFGRLHIVERDEYRLHARPDPFAWTLYQWLIENGLTTAQAQIIARAYLRSQLDWPHRLADLRLPSIEAKQQLWHAPLVQISPSAVRHNGDSIVQLVDGRLTDQADTGLVILSLFDALEPVAEMAKQIAEAIGNEWSGELMIAADPRTPFATFERVAYTAERVGYRRLGLIVEPRLFDYRVIPLALAPSDRLALGVTVYPDKSRVRVDPTHPPGFDRSPTACDGDPKPQVILRGTAEMDYARLLDVLVQYRACERSLKLPTPAGG